MVIKCLGKISVPTLGTPVALSATSLLVKWFQVAVVVGETGRVFLGGAGMNKSTHVGVIRQYWPTGAAGGVPDRQSYEAAGNTLDLSKFYVDANVANRGAIVAYGLD